MPDGTLLLRLSRGMTVEVLITGGTLLNGRVSDIGADWFEIVTGGARRTALIRVDAVLFIRTNEGEV